MLTGARSTGAGLGPIAGGGAPPDPYELNADRAYGLAPGSLLEVFNRAGVISAGDVHVASVLCRLAGGVPEPVELAVALAARAPRMGHVLVDLAQVQATVVPSLLPGATEELDPSSLPWPSPETWTEMLASSGLCHIGEPAAGEHGEDGEARPLRLVGRCLYLERYWQDETLVAAEILARVGTLQPTPGTSSGQPPVDEALRRLFPDQPEGEQALAARRALTHTFSVISGGPGTGKTTTVARFLALVFEQALAGAATGTRTPGAETVPRGAEPGSAGPELAGAGPEPARAGPEQGRPVLPSVALAAPTGKAAARMAEAVRQEAARADIAPAVRDALMALQASTVHRLLGRAPGRQDRFRFGRESRLPHDVVVVDETSMMSLPLMARLLEAVRPGARLVLVGDHEQLASVEAGAVLADLVGPLSGDWPAPSASPLGRSITVLKANHRFAGPLAELSGHIRAGRSEGALALLDANRFMSVTAGEAVPIAWVPAPGTSMIGEAGSAELERLVVEHARRLIEAGSGADAESGLAALDSWRLLCAHRDGPAGVSTWNERVETWLARSGAVVAPGGWYAGRPVVVTENDYSLGLFNGDSGFTLARQGGGLSVAFRRRGGLELVSPARLGRVQTAYAMTAHRAQGSEFDRVCVLLPEPPARVLTRELLYTALTRARTGVVVVGTREALAGAIERPVARASRLTERTWGLVSPFEEPRPPVPRLPSPGTTAVPGKDEGASS